MEENKQFISLEEYKIFFERERDVNARKKFRDFLNVLDPLDDDYKFHPPYGNDPVCIKLGRIEIMARAQKSANGPDSDSNTPIPVDAHLQEGFSKIEERAYLLLEKIRDRGMNEAEYTSLLNETHSIYKDINNLMKG